MLVIYHSVTALAAREAAALHTRLFDEGDFQDVHERRRALAIVGGTGVLASKGLWYAGRDEAGRTIMALGRTSGADIAHRSFCGVAELFGVQPGSFMLQAVGGASRAVELLARTCKWLGMGELAHTYLMRELDRDLPHAKAAAESARRRLAGWGRLYP